MTKQTFLKRALFVLGAVMSLLYLRMPIQAQSNRQFEIDLIKFTQETQKMSQDHDKMNLVWWIPVNFWKETFKRDPSVSRKDAEEFIDAIDDYVMVAIVDATIDDYGTASYKSYYNIKNNLSILDRNQEEYLPLSSDKVSSEANELLSAFKPIMANMLGNLGQNMHIFLFPKKDSRGVIIDDPKTEGSFTVNSGSSSYKWKLPLISLYPVMPCEKCQEECSTAWHYCPWCGTQFIK